MNSGDRKVYVIFFLILFLGFLSTLLLMVLLNRMIYMKLV